MFVLLRGGFDGLAAVVPYGDAAYAVATRRAWRFSRDPNSWSSTIYSGSHPGLAPLRDAWQIDELVVLHAMAIRSGRAATSTARRFSKRARSPRRVVGWVAEPAAAGDAGQALGDCDCVGIATIDERLVRRADVVACAARRR